MNRIFNFISITIVFLVCNSCSEMFDCIASTKPELESKTLKYGSSGQAYEDSIRASVKNTSNDDSFYYYFSIEGNLPPGITYSEQGRNLVFQGSPSETGSYTFNIVVTIEYSESDDPEDGLWEDNNRICFGNDTVSKNYTITIQ